MTGAPGSKWSSVARTIYWSDDLDQSDYTEERTFVSDLQNRYASHIGAYWDPGMEFNITEWDKPFHESGDKIRLIKSHTFAHYLNELKELNYPIIMVYSNDYECMNQWFNVGGFDITYPNYKPYYKNADNMWEQIVRQNRDIINFIQENRSRIDKAYDNIDLCHILGITVKGLRKTLGSDQDGFFTYVDKDIAVYVYK
jgi:hypothetical protein